jgi:5'-nucleotidase
MANSVSTTSSTARNTTQVSRQLFCNRDVELDTIDAVGFDMDFTLAQYNTAFDLLAYNAAKQKLVHTLHYPAEVMDLLVYAPDTSQRGCLLDKKRGNCLKPDQYQYVTSAAHGLTPLPRDERKQLYRDFPAAVRLAQQADFYNIDTPFGLVDACLFLQLVDARDRFSASTASSQSGAVGNGQLWPDEVSDNSRMAQIADFFRRKSYYQLWLDMRKCIDRCHFDGAIKHAVALDPARYIVPDDHGES